MPKLLVAVLVLLASPAAAHATPARVAVFELTARAAPRERARVLHVFVEDELVSVDETAKDGWRRVRLPNGHVGWARDEGLEVLPIPKRHSLPPLHRAPPRNLGSSLPPLHRAPPSDLRRVRVVGSLGEARAAILDDPQLRAMAAAIDERDVGAKVLLASGGTTSLALILSALAVDPGGCGQDVGCRVDGNWPMLFTGAVLGLGSALGYALLHADKGDTLELIDRWNARHPDRPLRHAR